MKKSGVALLLISVLLFSIISVNFVSAGLLEDVWNKITGRTTENVTETCPGIPISRWCPDETTLCPMTTDEQGCSVWDCDACEPEPPEPEKEICCKITTVAPGMTGARVEYEQILKSECPPSELLDGTSYEIVADEYCVPEIPPEQCEEGKVKYYICEDGTKIPECECENEVWICKVSVKDGCPESPEPETCAANIQITFNKDVYIIGDPVKIIIEIFDSQGNHLPNYAFYGQMYDDRWHTPDLQKTDNNGYFIHTGTAEKPGGGVTEVQFKVYTKETSSCGSVEDTAEVKFELGECGIGGCVPEPECKDKIRMCGGICPPCPEDDEDGEIFYPCSGCELEDKCYPYGYRKAGNYCSDENDIFVVQLGDDEKCENNFECKTNLCINGNCVSSNLWNKFLEWFKKLFGNDKEPKDCSKLLIEKDIGDYEYNQTLYGFKEAQVPVYSEDGEQKEIIKCCAAQYFSQEGRENMGLVCPFDSREDVENSINWLLVKNANLVLDEYKGEKVLNDQNKVIAWTSNTYIVATGAKGGGVMLVEEDVAGAYLKKYPNDLEEIDIGDLPPIEPESCEEIEDNIKRGDCYINLAIGNSDVNICEEIVYDSEHRDKCYVVLAEHTGDANICENVDDSSLREKCYFWVAEQEGDVDVCEEIIGSTLQNECYVHVAEKTGDAGFCDKIDDSHIGDKCYRDVGIQTDDRSLCEKIIEDRARQKCLDNTS